MCPPLPPNFNVGQFGVPNNSGLGPKNIASELLTFIANIEIGGKGSQGWSYDMKTTTGIWEKPRANSLATFIPSSVLQKICRGIHIAAPNILKPEMAEYYIADLG